MPSLPMSSVFRVEAAWTSAPWAVSPTWTDITADVRVASWGWAGAPNGAPAAAGAATLTLENKNGEYDPDNPGSTLGNTAIRRHRLFRFLGSDDEFATAGVPLFTGYLQDPLGTATSFGDNEVRFQLIDGIGILALFPVDDLTQAEQWSGRRIADVLTEIGWPAHLTGTIADGTVRVARETITAKALAAINEYHAGECGWFYVDQAGLLQFRDRYAQLATTAWNTTQATLDEDVIAQEPVTTGLGAFDAVERFTAAAASGTTFVFENLTSGFPPVSDERVMRTAVYDADAEVTAERLQKAGEYTGQRPHAIPMMIAPRADSTALGHLVNGDLDPGNRVTATWTPRGHTAPFSFDGTVVGWAHEATQERWDMAVMLAPYATTWQTDAADFYSFGATIAATDTIGA